MSTKEEQIAVAEAVVGVLDDALTNLTTNMMKAGMAPSDRALMTGVTSFFMKSMALAVPVEHWAEYLASLLTPAVRERMLAARQQTDAALNEMQEKYGVTSLEDVIEKVQAEMAEKRSTSAN